MRPPSLRAQVKELLEDHPAGLTVEDIVWEIWGGDHDGGPLTAPDMVRRALSQLGVKARVIYVFHD